jgi:hypothetical protein
MCKNWTLLLSRTFFVSIFLLPSRQGSQMRPFVLRREPNQINFFLYFMQTFFCVFNYILSIYGKENILKHIGRNRNE